MHAASCPFPTMPPSLVSSGKPSDPAAPLLSSWLSRTQMPLLQQTDHLHSQASTGAVTPELPESPRAPSTEAGPPASRAEAARQAGYALDVPSKAVHDTIAKVREAVSGLTREPGRHKQRLLRLGSAEADCSSSPHQSSRFAALPLLMLERRSRGMKAPFQATL